MHFCLESFKLPRFFEACTSFYSIPHLQSWYLRLHLLVVIEPPVFVKKREIIDNNFKTKLNNSHLREAGKSVKYPSRPRSRKVSYSTYGSWNSKINFKIIQSILGESISPVRIRRPGAGARSWRCRPQRSSRESGSGKIWHFNYLWEIQLSFYFTLGISSSSTLSMCL